jgi:CRISPR-associated protein Csb1
VNGRPNPEARVLGGVLAKGPIERNVTINLVALRTLRGKNDEETKQIRKYLLSLALLAATAELDLFLREGCLLRYADTEDVWMQVPRRGEPSQIEVPGHDDLVKLATDATNPFKEKWPKDEKGQPILEHRFDIKKAKELLSKGAEEEADAS